jgi:hypothetical protein
MRDELRSLGEQMGVKDGASCFNTTFAGFVPVTLDHSFGASVAMCFDPKENPAKGGVGRGRGQRVSRHATAWRASVAQQSGQVKRTFGLSGAALRVPTVVPHKDI